jgi:hypothetical protein
LGTPQDSDADGLTDAYERLVSHSDPLKPDSGIDGISDLFRYLHGLQPGVPIAIPSLSAISIPTCAVP